MLSRILALRKSMFVQMVLLTAIFLGWGVYVFVIRPIADIPVTVQTPSPLSATETRLRQVLHSFMIEKREHPDNTPDITKDPFLRQVQARNPDFRYYVRVGNHTFGDEPPMLFRQMKLDGIVKAHRVSNDPDLCSQATKITTISGMDAYADFYMCQTLTYMEYRGLKNPVAIPDNSPTIRSKWFWAFSGNFLLAALGIFAIFALILLMHIISIRRVAALARSIDADHLDTKIPETGVATEILPLVRAVNNLVGKVDAAQRRATFFLSAAAHEMRTPLTVLRTRLELMDDGANKDKLIGDVRRLTRLVNQLLTLMSIGNRRSVTGLTDLVAAAQKEVANLTPLAEEAQVRLVLDSEVSTLKIPGDAALIGSAIANLVDNAISFAPPNTDVTIQVELPGGVSVRDHGPGLGDIDPENLFEPFTRTRSNRPGYGLGLAIVAAIARLHGGSATAADAEGSGAEFRVTFL